MRDRLQPLTYSRESFQKTADALAVALAASLPWSTSATSILAVLWLLAIIPTFELPSLRRIVLSPAGGIPLILFTLGAAGMLWAEIPWAERLNGISSFFKLLFIPLLLHQFQKSDRGYQVLIGFIVSCALLLVASWALLAWPELTPLNAGKTPGIPVKDYISQSAMFTICIFTILQIVYELWQNRRYRLAAACVGLAILFLSNILYVSTSRTALVVIPFLFVVYGFRLYGWKGAVGLVVGFVILTAIAWPSASYLRSRIDSFFAEVQSYRPDGHATSAGERLEFWCKSVGFIKTSPLIGHGTGSIRAQFEQSAVGRTGMAAEVSENPHNQILAIGIQLGLVGVAVLLAMWRAHLALFMSAGSFAAWVGLVFVIQNVVGSLFNSHLFDFTNGWLYVVGVGVAGGTVLKERTVRVDRKSILEK
jgi:O-antigen ligase